MSLREARQLALARHLRDPQQCAAPADLEERRVAVYRELVINNVASLLAGNFPVIRKLLDGQEWHSLVRRFYAEHAAHTPLFYELGSEFVRFLGEHPEHWRTRPFLHELAHYEWVELALELDATDLGAQPADPSGNVIDGVPVASPLAWVLGYRYPVHTIRPDHQPAEAPAEPTWLLVYRNRADKVQFQALRPLAARLLARLSESPELSGRQQVQALADEWSGADVDALLEQARALLNSWCERDVVLGTRL